MKHPVTPDGRYFVVRGRLWRCANPALSAERRTELTRELMRARRDVGVALRANDASALQAARRRVDDAKVALGERGPAWWADGAPDYNRRMARNTPYADWHAALGETQDEARAPSSADRAKPRAKTRRRIRKGPPDAR